MKDYLSTRAIQIEPSATMAVSAKAKELRNKGHDIISLGVGEPDFDTPNIIKEAAIKAIRAGETKYTPVDGIDPLKKAIVHKLQRDNQLKYELNQVLVTSGVKEGIYSLCQAVLNPDDEVIIPAPYWVSYPPIAKLAEAKPVIINAGIDQRFKITPKQLEAIITPKTRLFSINSPNNPSGMAYTPDELKALGAVLAKHPNILIMSDEIYEYILWSQDKAANLLNVCPELMDRTIVLNGVSKAYAMTGWRIGYAAGPADIIQAMKKMLSQITTCSTSISQFAAATALEIDKRDLNDMYDAFKERHDIVYQTLKTIKNVRCIPSDGTFYSFIDVSKVITQLKLKSDIEFATYLLNEANVAVVPGTAFGSPGHVRISFALGNERLQEALNRILPILNS